jgi:subtilisin family serine protease
MDPALQELIRNRVARGGSADEVSVILRLRRPSDPPAGVRIMARFGDIATARVPVRAIEKVWQDPRTASVKAPRDYRPEVEPAPAGAPDAPQDNRRPPGPAPTGRGVLVGFVDFGCDVGHPDFRTVDGRTRLRALWDQRDSPEPALEPYGHGRVLSRARIDAALRTADPYAALNCHPADFDPGTGAHGTHTLSIAAGNGFGGGPVGVAPEAELAFVTMRGGGPDEPQLGSSVDLLNAVHFLDALAGEKPCVINLSLGRHAGAHTGRSLVEQALDYLVSARLGRAVVQSCGNYHARRVHEAWQLRLGHPRTLTLVVDPADPTPNEIDIWYPGVDRVVVELSCTELAVEARIGLGAFRQVEHRGREIARVYHRAFDPNTGDHQCSVWIEPTARSCTWQLTLHPVDVLDGRVHAWIERDSACRSCQSHFPAAEADPRVTLGSIATGYRTIAVGAYDAHNPASPIAPFSSAGPTRDGRHSKPDLVAPGVMVLGARSSPRDRRAETPPYVRMSGTSMAAPAVTGAVALLFEVARRPLPIEVTRRLVLASCTPPPFDADPDRFGAGLLDVSRMLAHVDRSPSPASPALEGAL